MNGLEAMEAMKGGAAIVRISGAGICERSEYRYRGGRLESRQADGTWGESEEKVDLFLSSDVTWGMAAYNLPFAEAMGFAVRGSIVECETGRRYRCGNGELQMLVDGEWTTAELSADEIGGMWRIHIEPSGLSRTI